MLALPVPLLLLLWWPSSCALAQSSHSATSVVTAAPSGSVSGSTSSQASSGSSSASATSSAAFPSLSGYSPCVLNCLALSISEVGCNSIVDVDCYCTNATRFVHDITGCVSGQCLGDLASAESVSQQFCNVASPSVSLSFAPLPSNSSSSSSSLSSSSSPQSSQSSTSGPSSVTPTGPANSSTLGQNGAGAAAEVSVLRLYLLTALSIVAGAALLAV